MSVFLSVFLSVRLVCVCLPLCLPACLTIDCCLFNPFDNVDLHLSLCSAVLPRISKSLFAWHCMPMPNCICASGVCACLSFLLLCWPFDRFLYWAFNPLPQTRRYFLDRYRLVTDLTSSLASEATALSERLERQRRLATAGDVDALLAELLGTKDVTAAVGLHRLQDGSGSGRDSTVTATTQLQVCECAVCECGCWRG